jgi:HEPN domain-containing protein
MRAAYTEKYDWCLFIGHLVLEKILKALCFVFQKREKNLRFFDVTYSPPIPV